MSTCRVILNILLIYLFLAVLGFRCYGGYSLVRELLAVVASLGAEHRVQAKQASEVVACGLSS